MNSQLSFEDVIAERGELIYSHVGESMYPLIRDDRDLLVIKAVSSRLKRLDIPLYKRYDGRYILHRIIKVNEHDYVIRGDNCSDNEYGITDAQIIGVLTAIVRGGTTRSVYSLRDRIYAHLWCDTPIFKWAFHTLRKIYGHILSFVRRLRSRDRAE